ncbi:MAG: hypothetical protein Ct9H90mP8_2410 [Pseudomonadota bacterium]|nr:MAG: hypothetical protein Ct9H90mP8_2410 [Pseudomonadota bacterium]
MEDQKDQKGESSIDNRFSLLLRSIKRSFQIRITIWRKACFIMPALNVWSRNETESPPLEVQDSIGISSFFGSAQAAAAFLGELSFGAEAFVVSFLAVPSALLSFLESVFLVFFFPGVVRFAFGFFG